MKRGGAAFVCNRAWLVLAMLLLAGAAAPHLWAQTRPAGSTLNLREYKVARDALPGLLRTGKWHAVNRSEYDAFRDSAAGKRLEPPRASLVNAEYSAVLIDDTLRNGQITAAVAHRGRTPELLTLDPLNLAVSKLAWSNREAVWGNLPDGRTSLVVSTSGELSGEWNLKGRRLARGVEFDLHVAPAAVSQFRIKSPRDFTASVSTGTVRRVELPDEPAWTEWKVDLGSQTHTRLLFTRNTDAERLQPVILAENDVSCVARREGIQFQIETAIEVLEAPVRRLEFLLPKSSEVYSTTLAGEAALVWKTVPADDGLHLEVELPEPMLGSGRAIRIQGISRLEGNAGRLPQARLLGAAFVGGETHLRVENVLQLRSVKPSGFRQTGIVADPQAGETFTFEQFRGDGFLEVELGRPDLKLTSRVLSLLRAEPRNWEFRSRIHWTARSGSTYSVAIEVADGWEIRDVVADPESAGVRVSNWRVDETNGTRALRIEFLEALTPEHSKSLRIIAERESPADAFRQSLPVLSPLDCETVESVIAVSHPPEFPPMLVSARGYELTDAASISANFSATSLWKEITALPGKQTLIRSTVAQEAAGELLFEGGESAFSAVAAITLDTTAGRAAREQLRLDITPEATPLDTVLVYWNGATAVDWTWRDADGRALDVRPSSIDHEDLGLPLGGGLWEIRLPGLISETTRVIAERTRTWARDERIALLLVPAARDFTGIVELVENRTAGLEAHAEGPIALAADDVPTSVAMPAPQDAFNRRWWRYDAADDQLEFRSETAARSSPVPQAAYLTLHSLMHSGRTGYDIHRARYNLVGTSEPAPFRFTLPTPAMLVATRLNGRLVTATRQEEEFVLPPGPAGEPQQIEIEYRVPAVVGALKEERTIIVPDSQVVVLDVSWEFALPPEARLAAAPSSLVLTSPIRASSWTERFFGPLGREDSSLFNPFERRDWERLLQIDRERAVPAVAGELVTPAGWSLYRAEGPALPPTLHIETWHRTRLNLIAWVALIGTILVALVLRKFRVRWRGRIGAIWLATWVAVGLIAPDPLAEIVGSLIAGTLIAALFPRTLLHRTRPARPAHESVPVGSTASFRHSSVTAPVVLLIALIGSGSAQPLPESSRIPADAGVFGPGAVLTLEDGPNEGEVTEQVVYVSPDLADQISRHRQNSTAAPQYLIGSARYVGHVSAQQTVEIEAHYRIAVLTANGRTSVRLPLVNANLGGEDVCRVNGRPHSVLPGPGGVGYRVDLSPELLAGEAENPAIAEVPTNSAGREPDVLWYDLVLHLNPASSAGAFELGVPAVADSRLELTLDAALPPAEVRTARGTVTVDEVTRRLSADLGRTDRISVRWSSPSKSEAAAPALDARLITLAEIRPQGLQFRIRAEYHVVRGKVDFVEWRLPARAIVRRVIADPLLGATKLPSDQMDACRLLIEFASPLAEDFVVEALVDVPATESSEVVEIPRLPLHEEGGEVRVTLRQLGIASPSQFRLTPLLPEGDQIRSVSIDSLPKGFTVVGTRKPEFAWQLSSPTAISCQLELVKPQRKVLQTHEARIGPGRLEWQLNAEIQTSTAPVFRHTLRVDPRLQIESITVEEDEAERLVRWQRTGELIELFLSDRTTGTQDLTIKATMPIEGQDEFTFPIATVENAETTDSNLLVYADPSVDVDVIDPAGLDAIELTPDASSRSDRLTLIGRFRGLHAERAPRIRFAPRTEQMIAETAIRLSRQVESGWDLAVEFRVIGSERLPRELAVIVPAEIAPSLIAHLPEGTARTDRLLANGSLEMRLRSEAPVGSPLTFSLTAPLPAGDAAGFQVPVPRVSGAAFGDVFLLVDHDDRRLLPDKAAVPIASDLAPSWIADLAASLTKAQIYRIHDTSLRSIALTRLTEPGPAVPLVYHRVWLTAERAESGTSEFRLRPGALTQLAIECPEDLEIRGAVVAGESLELTPNPAAPGLFTADLPPGASRVTLCWRRTVSVERVAERRSMSFPSAHEVTIGEVLVAAVPLSGTTITYPRLMETLNADEHRLALFEAMLQVAGAESSAGRNPPIDWDQIVLLQNLLEQERRRDKPARTDDEFVRERRARVAAALSAFETLNASIVAVRGAESASAPAQGPVTRGRAWNAIEPDDSDIVFGRLTSLGPGLIYRPLPGGVISVVIASLVFIVLVPVLRKFVRLETGEWLNSHRPIAWGLLGLVWWLCLRPSVIGLVLFLVAGAVAVRRRVHESRQSEVYI